jgi:hypothetical protein
MAPKRSRFKCEGELHAILSEFIVSPWWLKYPEKPRDPIKKAIIIAHGGLLRKLREIAPNLCFVSADIKKALQQIADEQSTWPLLKEEVQDWIDKNDKRIRTMCRHTTQALLKKRGKTHWLNMVFKASEDAHEPPAKRQKTETKQPPIPEDLDEEKIETEAEDEEEEEEEQSCKEDIEEAEDASGKEEIEQPAAFDKKEGIAAASGKEADSTVESHWESAFCRTHHQAWRRLPGCKKEYTSDIFAAESAKPEDMVTARWADGYEVLLSEITVDEWKDISQNMGSKRNRAIREWQGALKSGEQLWIAERKDHKVLLVLFEDGKALIYLPACNKEVALKILKEIATEYIEGTLLKAALREEKNKRFKAATAAPDKPEIRKRPAAAMATKPEASAAAKPENSSTPSSSSSSSAAVPRTPSNAPSMLSTMMGNPPPETSPFELMYS